MRKLFGIALLLVGLTVCGYAYLPASADRETRLVEVTRILTGPVAEVPGPVAARATAVDPARAARPAVETGSVVATVLPPAGTRQAAAAAGIAANEQVALAAPPPSARSQQDPALTWRSVVTSEPAASGAADAAASAKPADRLERHELVRAIQRELQRVGCYRGDVDGSWGSRSKRAMGAFVARVNASLPMDKPDEILLTLIKGHTDNVCGKTCPQGQTLIEDRGCVPATVLAQQSKRKSLGAGAKKTETAQATQGWSTETRVAIATEPPRVTPPVAPLAGRMSVGAPIADPASSSNAWSTEVVTPVTPGKRAAPAAVAPPPQPETKTAALIEADPVQPTPAVEPADTDPVAAVDPAYPGSANTTAGQPKYAAPAVTYRAAKRQRGASPVYRVYVARAPVVRARNSPVRATNYRVRSVQNLFMHPLGRM